MKTTVLGITVCLVLTSVALADDNAAIDPVRDTVPKGFTGRGYEILTTKTFLPIDLDQEVFDNIWRVWEEPLRSQAEKATPEERRQMAFSRYGFTSAPGDTSGKPQQYVVDQQGKWTMTCLACHQGKVAGMVIPGLPNSHFALQTFSEDVRATKMKLQEAARADGPGVGHVSAGHDQRHDQRRNVWHGADGQPRSASELHAGHSTAVYAPRSRCSALVELQKEDAALQRRLCRPRVIVR